jgi:tRNA-guanine family transglycosylase
VVRTGDSLGGSLLTLHNLHFFQRLMEAVQEAISGGTFADLRRRIHEAYPDKVPGRRPRPRE